MISTQPPMNPRMIEEQHIRMIQHQEMINQQIMMQNFNNYIMDVNNMSNNFVVIDPMTGTAMMMQSHHHQMINVMSHPQANPSMSNIPQPSSPPSYQILDSSSPTISPMQLNRNIDPNHQMISYQHQQHMIMEQNKMLAERNMLMMYNPFLVAANNNSAPHQQTMAPAPMMLNAEGNIHSQNMNKTHNLVPPINPIAFAAAAAAATNYSMSAAPSPTGSPPPVPSMMIQGQLSNISPLPTHRSTSTPRIITLTPRNNNSSGKELISLTAYENPIVDEMEIEMKRRSLREDVQKLAAIIATNMKNLDAQFLSTDMKDANKLPHENIFVEHIDIPMGSKKHIVVKHLPLHMTETEFYSYFSQFGRICKCKLSIDKKTGVSLGFGFLEFMNENDAAICIQRMDGSFCLDYHIRLKVNYAVGGLTHEELFDANKTNVYVAGLPYLIESEMLNVLFAPFGTICECRVAESGSNSTSTTPRQSPRITYDLLQHDIQDPQFSSRMVTRAHLHSFQSFAFIRFADKESANKCVNFYKNFAPLVNFTGQSAPITVRIARESKIANKTFCGSKNVYNKKNDANVVPVTTMNTPRQNQNFKLPVFANIQNQTQTRSTITLIKQDY